ncbi:uncharacterized protein LOC142165895 [Nicotiana tabacum]|uniref:Uncharacterized protein LOC142165895 n=1 Tax=Nicotiana tabacum TaxID=4097 RepID=A0AC58S5Z4_TOBAC
MTKTEGYGMIFLKINSGKVVTLNNVCHVTEIRKNLVSISLLIKNGFKYIFVSDKIIISKNGMYLGKGYITKGLFKLNDLHAGKVKGISKKYNGLYNLQQQKVEAKVAALHLSRETLKEEDLKVWHERLGHAPDKSSCVHTPQKNGVVEKKHRHIGRKRNSTIGNLPLTFWGKCVQATVYVINRLTLSVLSGKSSFEILYGKAPSLKHLRTIGCLCFATNMTRSDKDVKFMEHRFPFQLLIEGKLQVFPNGVLSNYDTVVDKPGVEMPVDREVTSCRGTSFIELIAMPSIDRPFERGGKVQEMVAKVPIGFQHEFGDIYSCWMLGGKRHEIYEKRLGNEFSCDKLLECEFCCVIGSHSSSHVDCEHVKVFDTSKEAMHDYCDVSDQMLFHELIYDSFCDPLSNCLESFDVENIILESYNHDLECRNSRMNFLQEDENDSILGSSNLFKDEDESLESQRGPFTRSQFKKLQNKKVDTRVVIILVYIDDLLITRNDQNLILEPKTILQCTFKIKDLGELEFFLGIEIERSKQGILINQRKFALELINELGLAGSKPVSTPVECNQRFTSVEFDKHTDCKGDEKLEDARPYQRLVGKLLYLTWKGRIYVM